MKRLFSLFLVILLVVSTFSCGKNDAGSGAQKPSFGYESVTLEGIDVKNLTVAVSSKAYINDVEPLVKVLARYSGGSIPVKTLSDLTDKDKSIILVGASSLDGTHEKYWGMYGYRITAPNDGRVVISVDFSNVNVVRSAVNKLVSLISKKSNGDSAILTLKEKDCLGYSFEDDLPKWALKEETTSAVTDGVTYTYQLFYDEKGLPYRVYVLKIDPSKAYLYTGTSGDGYDYVPPSDNRQNVRQHISAAVENGTVPVAAVNADFFAISSDYHPQGLCIKEGTVIAGTRGRPWCGFTYDGTFVCGSSDLYKKYEGNLRTAVGASNVLVTNGTIIASGTKGAHPRTLAGVGEDGTIILAVIDGRQPNVSNGAEFARCSALMISHGAYNAVNLDGGGSSTMIISLDGDYKTVNSPSDGQLRKVYNSLLIVPKDN